MVPEVFLKFVLSLGIGALIGIEREQRGKGEFAQGVRTFILASLLGTISAHFSFLLNSFLPFYIAFVISGILTTLGYINKSKKKRYGLTTEFAFLLTFLLGVLVYFDNFPFYISISLAILLTFLLASKELLHTFSKHLKREEIWSAVFFAVLSFVVLPILPNRYVDPLGIFNPFLIWASIVAVLSISFIAYILIKIFKGREGVILTGILGGMVSSTAVTISMIEEVKKNKKILEIAVVSILLASATMFLRVFFLASIFNFNLLPLLFQPFFILAILNFLPAIYLSRKTRGKKSPMILTSPLQFKVAFFFTALLLLTLVLIHLVKLFFGEEAIYLISFLAGLANMDAITISLSSSAFSTISPSIAVKSLILASISNTFSKWLLAFALKQREIAFSIGKIFFFLILASIAMLFFF
ncbi:MAG: DUF4010 domain-containing protein [Candidatus Aenigmatarchaeota archaeon]